MIIVVVVALQPCLTGIDVISQFSSLILTAMGVSEQTNALAVVLLFLPAIPFSIAAVPGVLYLTIKHIIFSPMFTYVSLFY